MHKFKMGRLVLLASVIATLIFVPVYQRVEAKKNDQIYNLIVSDLVTAEKFALRPIEVIPTSHTASQEVLDAASLCKMFKDSDFVSALQKRYDGQAIKNKDVASRIRALVDKGQKILVGKNRPKDCLHLVD